MVEFCGAERTLYDGISAMYINRINGSYRPDSSTAGKLTRIAGLSADHNRARQYKCILGMFGYLRMLATHVLVPQKILHDMIDDNFMTKLWALVESTSNEDDPTSAKITHLIDSARDHCRANDRPTAMVTDADFLEAREEVLDGMNWIPLVGSCMPGAKLDRVKEIVAAWIAADPEVKIVVFSQFLGFVDVFSKTCEAEGWGYATVSLSSVRTSRCLTHTSHS